LFVGMLVDLHMNKTWVEKRDRDKKHQVKINPKSFADMPAGIKMLIPTPKIVDDHVNQIPRGEFRTVKYFRKQMAGDYNADNACPLVTGISLRIVAEASYEKYKLGIKIKNITPFWRVVDPGSKLASKLTCGMDFIIENQVRESISL